jgi:hypothetical protein
VCVLCIGTRSRRARLCMARARIYGHTHAHTRTHARARSLTRSYIETNKQCNVHVCALMNVCSQTREGEAGARGCAGRSVSRRDYTPLTTRSRTRIGHWSRPKVRARGEAPAAAYILPQDSRGRAERSRVPPLATPNVIVTPSGSSTTTRPPRLVHHDSSTTTRSRGSFAATLLTATLLTATLLTARAQLTPGPDGASRGLVPGRKAPWWSHVRPTGG